MTSTKKLSSWLDRHLLEIIAGFLLAFIPLYPKWPLFDVLPGYNVRVRLEDFVILFGLIAFIIQVVRGKASLKDNPLTIPIFLYWIIGFLSVVSAVFLTHTIPLELPHVGKALFHWARRVEYMSVSFIFFSAIKNRQALKRVLAIFALTAVMVTLYGFGQKYLQWPVYSTMNREFSKGWRLVLTEHARVSSTFAGHYDLGAYMVIALLFFAVTTTVSRSFIRWLSLIAFILSFAILLLTASRTSFLAYVGSLTLAFLLLTRYLSLKKVIISWLIFMLISAVGIRSFGSLYSRFAHILRLDRVETMVVDTYNRFKPDFASRRQTVDVNQDLQLVYTDSDQPPTPPEGQLPPDVYEDIPVEFSEASLSAIPSSSGTGNEGDSRDFSQSAYTFGLSSAIRLDALWPRALAGFKANPLLGSGYSTLVKTETTQFTEAESTDNDYLRALGETGLLGAISFYGIFALVLFRAFQTYRHTKDRFVGSFLIVFITSMAALLVNAMLIDVFEASKVAYMVWAFVGITFAVISFTRPSHESSKT